MSWNEFNNQFRETDEEVKERWKKNVERKGLKKMTAFECDYSYDIREYNSIIVDADTKTEAEYKALDAVRDGYPDVHNIEVDEIREVTNTNG